MRRQISGICLVIISLIVDGCGFKTNPRPSAATVPGDIGIVEVQAFPDHVILKWEAPLSNVDGSLIRDISGFKVYRISRPAGEECENCQDEKKLSANVDFQKPVNAEVKGREVTYIDKDVSPGNSYVYAVSTYNLKGREGPQSPEVSVVLDDFPPPPEGLTAQCETEGVTLRWNAAPRPAGIRSYRIYRGESESVDEMKHIGSTKWAETTYTDKWAEKDKSYYYCVRSLKMNRGIPHESRSSEPVRIRVVASQLPSPENVVVVPARDGIHVRWDPIQLSIADARYNVYRSESSGVFEKVNTEPLVATRFVDRDVRNGRIYRYAITCFAQGKPYEESSRTASEAVEFKP